MTWVLIVALFGGSPAMIDPPFVSLADCRLAYKNMGFTIPAVWGVCVNIDSEGKVLTSRPAVP